MIREKIWLTFEKVRKQGPLIQNITNLVVMEYTANILLATGASPIMSNITEEFKDLYRAVKAISINMGTLDSLWIDNIKRTLKIAKENNIPIVFDPVASGATEFRTTFAKSVVKNHKVTVIRANPSEILSLDDSQNLEQRNCSKGVDSTIKPDLALKSAKCIAIDYNAIVVITGYDDYVTDGKLLYKLSNGHSLMQRVTGMGCALSAFIACFVAVESANLLATTAATSIYGVVGSIAGSKSAGPGSFQQIFLDVLYTLKKEQFLEHLKILEC